uniref:NADH-ubiquinone oxidoreductase chain 2 n=1 Tax=Callicerus obscurus TaxID=877884 RepID=A0A0S2M705_9COLE|nr:NADH dehydrogenase subunit 2 [Callicerus obscurus]ALO70429.1 NADH deshydrogenase subunit 2 [Callicerus obscurus]
MLFFIILMIGSLISISSNSWMGMWLGLEINLLAFIPLIQEKNNTYASESSLKYFLTQALASIILLFSLIFMAKNLLVMKNTIDNSIMIMFNSTLLTKMGMAPFHFWFPEVIEGLNWLNCLILLTWQKITPMILVMYNMKFQYFFMTIIIFSMLISGFMGLNQVSLRKILAYSSINHMAWMISTMFFSETIWLYYFIVYSILTMNILIMFKLLNIFYYNQILVSLNKNFMMKFLFSFNFLSLGGLPPFLGFFPKWLTIQYLINSNWILLTFMMILLTLLTLFYYMRLIFNILIISTNEINYFTNNIFKNFLIIIFNISSLSSLLLISLTFNFT